MYKRSGFKKNDNDALEAKISMHSLDSTYCNLLEQERSRQTTFQMHLFHFWILEKLKLILVQSLSETGLAGTDASRKITAWLLMQVLISVLPSQTELNSHICWSDFFFTVFYSNLINDQFLFSIFSYNILLLLLFIIQVTSQNHSREQSLSLSIKPRRTDQHQLPGNEQPRTGWGVLLHSDHLPSDQLI